MNHDDALFSPSPPDESPPSASAAVRAAIDRMIQRATSRGSMADAIVEVGFKHALEGDYRFWKEIMDRAAGKSVIGSPIQQQASFNVYIAPAPEPESEVDTNAQHHAPAQQSDEHAAPTDIQDQP